MNYYGQFLQSLRQEAFLFPQIVDYPQSSSKNNKLIYPVSMDFQLRTLFTSPNIHLWISKNSKD